MKIGQAIRWVVVLLAAAVVLAGVGLRLFGDRALKVGIEKGATRALNVEVKVRSVSLEPSAGRAGLEGLAVGNPPGYQHEKLLELGRGGVQLELRSLLTEAVTISSIRLDEVTVVIEQKGLTNNLQEVLQRLEVKDKASAPARGGPAPKEESRGKALHIETLEINNTTVQVKLPPLAGRQDPVSLKLAPIRLTNLGSDRKLDVAGLTVQVLLAIASGIAQQGAGVLPAEIVGPLQDQLKQLGALGEAALEQAQKALEERSKGVLEKGKGAWEKTEQDLGQGATEALQNVLKARPKEQEQKK